MENQRPVFNFDRLFIEVLSAAGRPKDTEERFGGDMVWFMRNSIVILATCLALAACSPFQPRSRPEAPLDMPRQYALFTEGEPGPDRWWHAFGSPELNRLVEGALSQNFDIQTAWARLRQAEAMADQARAGLRPTVSYEAGGKISRLKTQKSVGQDGVLTEEQAWNMGLAASYEVDLWGRLRSRREAESLSREAAREDLDAAAVTVAAKVVETWVDVVVSRHKIAILKEQIRNNEDLLDLQRLRFSNGRAKALDVSQQREALAAARAELPLLQLQESQLLNGLALLLGKASMNGLDLRRNEIPEPIPVPATGLPADLLASRPDVRAAGLRLRSADWEVSAARADRLPSINLSAKAAFSSGVLDLLFNNWLASLALAITGPLFDAGRGEAEVARVQAVAEELLTNYARTVATAMKEVEDSLVAESRQREYIDYLEDQFTAAGLALENARIQYRNGQSDYLSYLVAWTSVQNLERKLVGERAALIKNRVALYRALGGDWTGRLVESPRSETTEEKGKGDRS
ncbi:MAG: efflux transporter outer membrane subunit [Proteobacteria bacterium]|nr:efflux transporter outer membrane subunit [Pseudomonadota bacterium]